ncbi:MAG: hypothetical protein CVV23_08635 [Ignavibacteriae bacterium HGW-Ignavibacteriae-2]|nr:MAG: hypothetical protein CVV23_08635 [Ignavibacteriae bacterium HGW-Ignavibacteriae-2]
MSGQNIAWFTNLILIYQSIINLIMKKVIVIGGGLAGLSCSCSLIESGAEVILLEASPKLGGRAYSFIDENTGDIIDNGQHIMMGCYENTIEFLNQIDAAEQLLIQDELRVPFVMNDGSIHFLSSSNNRYPINLLRSIIKFTALSIKERIRVLDLFLDLLCFEEEDLIDLTVKEWLLNESQDENSIKILWEVLAIGTLNSKIEEASAGVFVNVLKRIFLGGQEASKIMLPINGLSEMYVAPAAEFIRRRGGTIVVSERVTGVTFESDEVVRIDTNKNSYTEFDFVVSTIPLHALSKIESIEKILNLQLNQIKYSPILSINIWLSKNEFTESFYALVDSDIHWLFNHGSYISLVTSAAEGLINLTDEEIMRKTISQLSNNFCVFSPDLILSYKILKEKRATYIPSSESIICRNRITDSFGNFILAGDWTELMLPATIESAVLSGRKAAAKILEYNR